MRNLAFTAKYFTVSIFWSDIEQIFYLMLSIKCIIGASLSEPQHSQEWYVLCVHTEQKWIAPHCWWMICTSYPQFFYYWTKMDCPTMLVNGMRIVFAKFYWMKMNCHTLHVRWGLQLPWNLVHPIWDLGWFWNLKNAVKFCICLYYETLATLARFVATVANAYTYFQTLNIMWSNYFGYLRFWLIWNLAIYHILCEILKNCNLVQDFYQFWTPQRMSRSR